jgi:hypothetical protein
MNSARNRPPRWAEALLERLLPDHARETIAGDLREEFIESVLPRKGLLGARIWYLRQVVSFVSWFAKEGTPVGKILLLVSSLSLACGCWLAVMEMLLRHPGYAGRIVTALIIIAICAGTLLARMLHAGYICERWLWLGAAGLILIGVLAFYRHAGLPHFDGFIIVIATLLVLQGILMFATMGRTSGGGGGSQGPIAPSL